ESRRGRCRAGHEPLHRRHRCRCGTARIQGASMTEILRQTSETSVTVTLDAFPAGGASVNAATTNAFLDHMLTALGRYAGFDLTVDATGDLPHHLIEDVAITL